MMRVGTSLASALFGATVLSSSPVAQHLPTSPTASLTAEVTLEEGWAELRVDVAEAAGSAFLWQVGPNPESGTWWNLGITPLEDGAGAASLKVSESLWLAASPLETRGVFFQGGSLVQTPLAPLEDIAEEPTGETWDFDWGSGGVGQVAGTVVSKEQPWSAFVTISAINANPAHPHEAVLFDSGAPTAGELATPGGGLGNYEAQGQLLVIAANLEDDDGDGLVDTPEAESAGGTLVFDFPGYSTVFGIEIVDVDEPGGEVRFLADGVVTNSEPLFPKGDNSVITTGGGFAINRVEVDLPGSAGIGRMLVNPCETVIDFDVSPTGIPWGLEAGQIMSSFQAPDVFGGILVFLTAQNGAQDHPDDVVLFDTENPSGYDEDLAAPGPGIGNDVALGKVLVIAENDEDKDGDLLVDEPDDEALGGVISLGWYTSCGRFRGATVMDIDAQETAWVEVFLEAGGSVVMPFESLGDNSVQTISADVGPTRQVDFHFSGSGALAEIRICPQP